MVEGIEYPVDTDFRVWIGFQSIFTSQEGNEEKSARVYAMMERLGLPASETSLEAMVQFFEGASSEHMGAESLTAGRNRVLRALGNSMPSMERRVTVATAAMMPSSAYADPFAAHRAYAQTGQNEQGQSAAPQRLKVDIEVKPKEAARFLKPRIDEEANRQGTSLTRGG